MNKQPIVSQQDDSSRLLGEVEAVLRNTKIRLTLLECNSYMSATLLSVY